MYQMVIASRSAEDFAGDVACIVRLHEAEEGCRLDHDLLLSFFV